MHCGAGFHPSLSTAPRFRGRNNCSGVEDTSSSSSSSVTVLTFLSLRYEHVIYTYRVNLGFVYEHIIMCVTDFRASYSRCIYAALDGNHSNRFVIRLQACLTGYKHSLAAAAAAAEQVRGSSTFYGEPNVQRWPTACLDPFSLHETTTR